ncbi:hypothetical protein NHX12_001160 [Muraenolepis orangiensis]|uniref:Uncharacterized protein n=1 Tax=Muraenolepis orangiensis TaxID=630683 RepID=A0A9Q0IH05_9TELE|nr:hypothetical protein NHX12_001160 [Muraenolepis orangiensis]
MSSDGGHIPRHARDPATNPAGMGVIIDRIRTHYLRPPRSLLAPGAVATAMPLAKRREDEVSVGSTPLAKQPSNQASDYASSPVKTKTVTGTQAHTHTHTHTHTYTCALTLSHTLSPYIMECGIPQIQCIAITPLPPPGDCDCSQDPQSGEPEKGRTEMKRGGLTQPRIEAAEGRACALQCNVP